MPPICTFHHRLSRFGAGVALTLSASLVALAGCGGGKPPNTQPTPSHGPTTAEQTLDELFNLTSVYRRLGRIAAGPPVPFVGQIAYLAGRGDSTIALLGLSLDNRALAFQRTGRDFIAHYRVEMSFQHGNQPLVRYARDEMVSVGSFQETQRRDETVVFQQAFLLAPGDYTAAIVLRDPGSGSFSRTESSITVPGFPPGSLSGPILVYHAQSRRDLWADPNLLLNPRGAVAHGDDSLGVYVEAYGLTGPKSVPFMVRDEGGKVVDSQTVAFEGGKALEGRTVYLAAETPSLGRMTLTLGDGAGAKQVEALVSFSRTWVLTNYDNLLNLLRYFGHDDQLDALRKASPEDRPALWRKFWQSSDPNPSTPENEALDLYFTRIAIANDRFQDEGGANSGWRTERGEVYITLGEPDQVYETPPGTEPRVVRWIYNEYRAVLDFEGQAGFTRLRLTPSSRAEFSRMRALARQRQRSGGSG